MSGRNFRQISIFGRGQRLLYAGRQKGGRLAGLLLAGVLLALAVSVSGAYAQDATAPEAPAAAAEPAATSQGRLDKAREFLRNNPISPPDTASPRATLESYQFIMGEVTKLWAELRASYDEGSNVFLTDEQSDQLVLLEALLDKATRTLDLSGIPDTAREGAGIELVLQLQEILDRIPPIDASSVPGETAGTFRTPFKGDNLPELWTIPGTSLSLARQPDGERRGHYLFSADSVERIAEDYAVVRELPMRTDRGEDLFRYYIYTPGNLIAPRWYDYLSDGPEWLRREIADQAYWQWFALALLVAAYLAVIGAYCRWQRWRAVSVSERMRTFNAILQPLAVIAGAMLFRYLCENQINITGTSLQIISTVATAVIWSATAWLTYQCLQFVYVWFVQSPGRMTLDANLLRTGYRVASLGVSLLVLGYGATKIGIPIYGVIAGLGVGGLAIALAAQPTIENLIGGIILYADRMVRVGEYCRLDDLAGTVESIGIRSTRIRALDRTLITVSNADLARRKIINYSYRDKFHFRHKISLRYETPAATMKAILGDIAAYLEAHEKVEEEPLRVRLVGFTEYAQTVDIYAYVSAPDLNAFLEIQEDILFDIHAIVSSRGIGFAYPSSTVFLGRENTKPSPEAAQAAAEAEEPATKVA